jgi:hypothetical protein
LQGCQKHQRVFGMRVGCSKVAAEASAAAALARTDGIG